MYVCVCMYICIYVCVYVCVYVCMSCAADTKQYLRASINNIKLYVRRKLFVVRYEIYLSVFLDEIHAPKS
jgi:hypothetical protein